MARALVAFLLLVSLAGGAAASEPGPAPNPTVLMSPIALPVVIDGKLANYVFVNVRLQLGRGVDSAKLRDKEPFYRDAILRAAYRTSLVQANDPNKIDEARFRALVLTETARVTGRGSVTGVTILRERPQKTLRLPPKSPAPSVGRPTP